MVGSVCSPYSLWRNWVLAFLTSDVNFAESILYQKEIKRHEHLRNHNSKCWILSTEINTGVHFVDTAHKDEASSVFIDYKGGDQQEQLLAEKPDYKYKGFMLWCNS